MASMNKVLLMGNLTRDPEVRAVPSGVEVADMRLAVNDRFKDREGKEQERTAFVDIVAWDRLAQQAGRSLRRGSTVLVEGRLESEEWTAKDGTKRSRVRVRADRIEFLDRAPRRDDDAPRGEQQGGPPDDAEGAGPAGSPRPPAREARRASPPPAAGDDAPF